VIKQSEYENLHKYLMLKATLGPEIAKQAMEIEGAASIAGMKASVEKAPNQATINQFNLATTLSSPTAQVISQMHPSFTLMSGNKEAQDKFDQTFSYFENLLESARANMPIEKKDKAQLVQYFQYQKRLLSRRGYDEVVKLLTVPDYKTILEAQEALQLAIEGVSPTAIVQALQKSRIANKPVKK
jgi:hypothetical protein